ncbi:phage head-tail connector protein [Jeotgalibacillus soli]|uniref:Uncharacterized protein n=1 Tax=Jeotgalibacillus soli TaxID=889306 RepID=A0A0C2VP25_9BACL|nr:phage head-tail connector protein [Jeotgalibacillus soli]KIL45758.1 hypothetical protein KP78_21070 [Jeotgalibacillus soli]
MTIEEIKAMIGLTGTTQHDTYLDIMVPMLVERAKEYCNNAFLDDMGVEKLPAGVKVFVAKGCQFNMNKSGLKSRSMGTVSYSYETDFPISYYKEIQTYRKVRFKG